MKLCNFRPMCLVALVVILTIASCLLSPWLALGYGIILVVVLYFAKLPLEFKLVAAFCALLTTSSFVLTTAFNPNPYYRTFNPQSGLRGVVLRYVDYYLRMFLSEENAELLYSMMFGDKSGLSSVIRLNFTASGLAHVLAVSGMNVAMLAGVVIYLLKICRVPYRARLYVVTPVLIFYAYLCGWQYSVLRAVIMFLTYLFAKQFLHIADKLSTLAFAAIVILIMFPYALVSASFLLSFSCLLGIYFFYDGLVKRLLVRPIAMYLAVLIATFPFMVYFFGAIPLYGVIASVVLVPLLAFSFYLGMFAITTVWFGGILFVAELLLNAVRTVSAAIVELPFAVIEVNSSYPEIIVYVLGLIVISRFVFLKPKIKYPLAITLFACYFLLIMI